MIEITEPLFWLVCISVATGWGCFIGMYFEYRYMRRKRDFWRLKFNELLHHQERERQFDMRPAPCPWPEGQNVVPLRGKIS
jgi:hypothetical protein